MLGKGCSSQFATRRRMMIDAVKVKQTSVPRLAAAAKRLANDEKLLISTSEGFFGIVGINIICVIIHKEEKKCLKSHM